MKHALFLEHGITIVRNFKLGSKHATYDLTMLNYTCKRTYFLELFNYEGCSVKEFLFSIFYNLNIEISLNSSSVFFLNFDKNFLEFLSKKDIFLSSEKILNDYMYYTHVSRYQEQDKKELINKFNLSSNFFSDQLKLINSLDKNLWSTVPRQISWFYLDYELFIHDEEQPFDTNYFLKETVDSMMYPYDICDIYLGSEVKSYNNDEPFFFFGSIIKQPMLDYGLISCLRHGTVFFEDVIFREPFDWQYDENHTFPHLSKWSHPKELKYGFRTIKQNMDFHNESSHLKRLSTVSIDIFHDTFDKHYIFIWNYLIGEYQWMDYFTQYEFDTHYQGIKMQLHNPIAHVTTKYNTLVNSYNSLYEKSFYLSIFPDNALQGSYINTILDYETAGYTGFFQVGFTVLDGLEMLEMWGYQAANIVWDGYENFVDDYDMFGACYIPDQMNAVGTALIIMMWKNFWSIAHFGQLLYNYCDVFGFLDIPNYQQNLVSGILYPLPKLQGLAQFGDEIPIEYGLNVAEGLACAFFGYNVSLHIVNHPGWYVRLRKNEEFLEQVPADIQNDIYVETMENNFLESLTSINLVKPTFSSMFISNNYKNLNFTFNVYFKYLNEKFLDDAGYFFSSFMGGEANTNKPKNFSFGDFWFLNHSTVLQYLHTAWAGFYTLGQPLDFFWWATPPTVQEYALERGKGKLDEWLSKTFIFDYSESLIRPAYIAGSGEIRFGANAPTYVGVYFYIGLDTILDLFIDANKFLNSKIFYPIHWLSSLQGCIFECITTEDAYALCIELIDILTTGYHPYFVIKIFDEPLKSYFDFIFQVYKSPEFQYLFDLIFRGIFVWSRPLISVNHYKYDNFPYQLAAVNYVDCGDRPLALEFWIPFLYGPQNDKIIIDPHPISLPFNINLADYFLEKEMSEEEYMEKLMMVFALHGLHQMEALLLANPEHYKFLLETSGVLPNQYGFEGFDGYLNYVLKHKLYISVPSQKHNQTDYISSKDLILEKQLKPYQIPEVLIIKSWYEKFLIKLNNTLWFNKLGDYFGDYDFHGMSQKDIDNFIYFLWKP